MKQGVLKRKKLSSTTGIPSDSDSLTRSELLTSQLGALFTKLKPFLGVEFWPWFENFALPTEACEALNDAGMAVLHLHAFVIHLTWQVAEESWEITWRVDENKLSPDFPLDRDLAHVLILKKVDQTMIDLSRRRICQTYEEEKLSFVW